MIWTVERV